MIIKSYEIKVIDVDNSKEAKLEKTTNCSKNNDISNKKR